MHEGKSCRDHFPIWSDLTDLQAVRHMAWVYESGVLGFLPGNGVHYDHVFEVGGCVSQPAVNLHNPPIFRSAGIQYLHFYLEYLSRASFPRTAD